MQEASIFAYFPTLSETQRKQIYALEPIYREWNAAINVISRKDMDNFYEHHVLHSLAIAKFIQFKSGSSVLDIGTGGGFPGIPLAIMFPEVKFHLIDSIGKKIHVVSQVVDLLGLSNVSFEQIRAEQHKTRYDFVVTRAVAPVSDLVKWSRDKFKSAHVHGRPNGLIMLKGGNIDEEAKDFGSRLDKVAISDYFKEDYFKEKYVAYIASGKRM